ncbi:thiamine pyrophosphate-binding protein [Streptomyces sp. SM1]|uniref:thiamine pyrophosphate-binding protein n=1 Tax=Streptomyces sp. SM1 TaxID=402229 RepID=UPI000CD57AD1|nr:thiamine pyrophosphate-binding protein [Streptomyces sp. SM1]
MTVLDTPTSAAPGTVPEPVGPPVTGADCLMRALEAAGTDIVFGMPGGAILPAYDALLDASAIQHVLVRHKQGAGHAAVGYTLATGRVGVCMATSGPGATNLVTAIADAHARSVPLVAITGQVPRSLLGRDSFQEVDICGITRSITRHNFLVTDAHEIADRVLEAFRLAADEEAGPVLVDITKDALQQQVSAPAIQYTPPAQRPGLVPAVPAIPAGNHTDAPLTPESVTAALARGSERPTAYVVGPGGHALWAEECPSATAGPTGYAVPAALGAAFGRPDLTVWAVTGEDCFLATGRELATGALNGIPFRVAVLRRDADRPQADLVGLAESMGCVGMRCTTPSELDAAIRRSGTVQDRPVLLDVVLP